MPKTGSVKSILAPLAEAKRRTPEALQDGERCQIRLINGQTDGKCFLSNSSAAKSLHGAAFSQIDKFAADAGLKARSGVIIF